MKVLITGAAGFLGKNLKLRLSEREDVEVATFTRKNSLDELPRLLLDVDFIFHLAGVNRASEAEEFVRGNEFLTHELCQAASEIAHSTGKKISIIYASSTQVTRDTAYGGSKLRAEKLLQAIARHNGNALHIFRLPNVFGKWCKPNYNSVVATFCHNIIRGLPIKINDELAALTLVYVDDVVDHFLQLMDGHATHTDVDCFAKFGPLYSTTVGELARQIQSFKDSRDSLLIDRVGEGLTRALYSTYVSYLPTDSFAYPVPQYVDARGKFVELIKTPDCGQVSFFSAHPGVTRGGHYHNSKTEKFLVIRGRARFKFSHVETGETYELVTTGENSEIVQTVPGWTHDITNIGTDEMFVVLWANEVFDRMRPDTFVRPL